MLNELMAGKQGIEPQFTVLETVVLPLHYSPTAQLVTPTRFELVLPA